MIIDYLFTYDFIFISVLRLKKNIRKSSRTKWWVKNVQAYGELKE